MQLKTDSGNIYKFFDPNSDIQVREKPPQPEAILGEIKNLSNLEYLRYRINGELPERVIELMQKTAFEQQSESLKVPGEDFILSDFTIPESKKDAREKLALKIKSLEFLITRPNINIELSENLSQQIKKLERFNYKLSLDEGLNEREEIAFAIYKRIREKRDTEETLSACIILLCAVSSKSQTSPLAKLLLDCVENNEAHAFKDAFSAPSTSELACLRLHYLAVIAAPRELITLTKQILPVFSKMDPKSSLNIAQYRLNDILSISAEACAKNNIDTETNLGLSALSDYILNPYRHALTQIGV